MSTQDGFKPDETILGNLHNMGFPTKLAVESLFISNNNFEQAVQYCLDHNNDPEYLESEVEEVEEEEGEEEGEEEEGEEEEEDYKMVLVVRTDLKMGKGKMCAQCAHAAVDGYRRIIEGKDTLHNKWLQNWEDNEEAKVAVKVRSEQELIRIQMNAMINNVPNALIIDAGRTQIEAGSKTVLSVGPAPCSVLDKITGNLKLL